MSDLSYVRNNDGTYSKLVQLSGSNIQQPVDIQSRLQTAIQTHNAVSVLTTATSDSTWIDCNGYDQIAITMLNSASAISAVFLHWSNDGVTWHGQDELMSSGTAYTYRAAITPVKARYCRVRLQNTDASTRTMSAWAYLKA